MGNGLAVKGKRVVRFEAIFQVFCFVKHILKDLSSRNGFCGGYFELNFRVIDFEVF